MFLYSQNIYYYTRSLKKIRVARDFLHYWMYLRYYCCEKADVNTDVSAYYLNTFLLGTLDQYSAKLFLPFFNFVQLS